MAITNPKMMSGTGGTPDFLVVGAGHNWGAGIKVGIRPLFEVHRTGSTLNLETKFRVRFQGDSGINANTLKQDVPSYAPKTAQHLKAKGDYGSYMCGAIIHCHIDKDMHKTVANSKKILSDTVDEMLNHLKQLGFSLTESDEDIKLWFMAKYEAKAANMHVDIGDLDTLDAPADQPLHEKWVKSQQNSNTKALGPKTKQQEDGEKQVEPDKYEQKKLTEDDLSDLDFDSLMKKIGKQ